MENAGKDLICITTENLADVKQRNSRKQMPCCVFSLWCIIAEFPLHYLRVCLWMTPGKRTRKKFYSIPLSINHLESDSRPQEPCFHLCVPLPIPDGDISAPNIYGLGANGSDWRQMWPFLSWDLPVTIIPNFYPDLSPRSSGYHTWYSPS